jgi:hypothetical protein
MSMRPDVEEHGDGRGLAGAVAAEQPDRLSGADSEADVVDRQGGAVSLRQGLHADRIHRVPLPSCGAAVEPQPRYAWNATLADSDKFA